MDPKSLHGCWFVHRLRDGEEHSLDDASEVSQVEEIVGFGRCGQQVLHGCLVNVERRPDNLIDTRSKVIRETLGCYMPVHDGPEDTFHGVVVKLVDGDGVEMT